jgi:hypothetical protein
MLRALADFACEIDGELIYVQKGVTRVAEDHPILTDSRHLFERVPGPRGEARCECRAYDGVGRLLTETRDAPPRGA